MRKTKFKKPIIDGYQFQSGEEGEIYEHIRDGTLGKLTGFGELGEVKLLSATPISYSILPSIVAGDYKFRALEYTPDFIVKLGKKEIVLEYKSAWSSKKPDYVLRKKMFLYKYKNELNFAELTKIKKGVYEFKKYYN